MVSALEQLLLDVVNREISDTRFYRVVAEQETWMVEGQLLPNGGVLPMISDEGGLGSVRLFTDRDAVKRWVDTLRDDRPRPFITLVGADLLGPMPPAVQQVIFNAGGPLTLRVLPPQTDLLRELSTAVRVERQLQTPAKDFGELAKTLFQHEGWRVVTGNDGELPIARGSALAFTAEDAAEAFRAVHPDGAAMTVQRIDASALFGRIAAIGGIEGVIFNLAGPGVALGLRMPTLEALARVEYVP